jgi:hypothetical protein
LCALTSFSNIRIPCYCSDHYNALPPFIFLLIMATTNKRKKAFPSTSLTAKKRNKSESGTLPYLPMAVLSDHILPHLSPNDMLSFVSLSKFLMDTLTHEMVVRNAVVTLSKQRKIAKRALIESIIQSVACQSHSVLLKDRFPSPMRILRMMTAECCENARCWEQDDHSLTYNRTGGVFLCNHCSKVPVNSNILMRGFVHGLDDFWSVENKKLESIEQSYAAALLDSLRYSVEENFRASQKKVALRRQRLQQILAQLTTMVHSPWKELAMKHSLLEFPTNQLITHSVDLTFDSDIVEQHIKAITKSPASKATIRNIEEAVSNINGDYKWLFDNGFHNFSFLTEAGRLPFERCLGRYISENFDEKTWLIGPTSRSRYHCDMLKNGKIHQAIHLRLASSLQQLARIYAVGIVGPTEPVEMHVLLVASHWLVEFSGEKYHHLSVSHSKERYQKAFDRATAAYNRIVVSKMK